MANPNTIPWLHYQDIQISDVTLRTQFRQYMQTGQYAEALSLLNNNQEQLQAKAYIANTINTITSGILELEEYYNTGVTLFLSNLASQYFNLVENLKKRGVWLSNIQYSPYNFVAYDNNIYMCIKQAPIGTIPTNTEFWIYIGLEGIQGYPGTNVTMKYDWNSNNTYSPNDLVVYDGDIYVALTKNTGVVPSLNESTWLLFLKNVKGQIYVGVNSPTNPLNNTIWFETQSDPTQATSLTPIIGRFKRYIENQNIWDDMYPNTIFNLIVDEGNYAAPYFNEIIVIQQNQWSSNQWTYNYLNLTPQNFVYILPAAEMNQSQNNLYNNLSISISGTNIVLTSGITPTSDLPINILII